MGLIPDNVIAEVLERSDIVETIASYFPLKRAGRNFKANCPFHNEKTPSFVVNPDKQIFHCFGCGAGGNVISFVMQQERVEFPEALRMLAEKHNITVPSNNAADSETIGLKDLIFKANSLAASFFHNILVSPTGEIAHVVKYLKDRGINLETVKKFEVGFAPDKWEGLLPHLKSKNIALSVMEKAGLIAPNENREGFHDRFRARITFPIYDVKGRCVAFGARTLKDDVSAKYINSPETAVYTKGRHLYGFHLTKDAVREKDFAIVVEGYMDFIVPFQAGATNIVASLGTALTTDQIRLLKRYANNIVMLFDADAAGENAMVRSLDLLVEEGMSVKVAALAPGEDPDSFVRKFGIEEFHKRIEEALPLFDYKFKNLTGRYSHKTSEGKDKIVSEMLTTILKFPSAVIRRDYIKRLSMDLVISEDALWSQAQKIKVSTQDKEIVSSATMAVANYAERNILRLMLTDESYIPLVKGEMALKDFEDEKIRGIVAEIFESLDQGRVMSTSQLLGRFDDRDTQQMISELLTVEEFLLVDREKIFRDCIGRIRSQQTKRLRTGLLHEIRAAEVSGDHNRLDELKHQFNQLIKR